MSFYRDYNDKLAFEVWNTRTHPQFKTIEVIPLSPAGGAEVRGVDLSHAISDEQFNEIQIAAAEYLALAFRDQKINTEQHKQFGLRFGHLHRHVSAAKRAPGGDPEILAWKTGKLSRFTAGEAWHNDVSCDETPISTSILRLTKQPDLGGNTAFVNTHLAYTSLSAPLQNFVDSLTAEHSGQEGWTNGYGEEPEPGQKYASNQHPVVLKHPATARKHLFVSRAFTTHIAQLTRPESQSVLELLNRHIETNLAFQFQIQWQPDSVILWDNWGAQHQAIWDYYPFDRWGERVSAVSGQRPQHT
jgi:taurine dioxygenase